MENKTNQNGMTGNGEGANGNNSGYRNEEGGGMNEGARGFGQNGAPQGGAYAQGGYGADRNGSAQGGPGASGGYGAFGGAGYGQAGAAGGYGAGGARTGYGFGAGQEGGMRGMGGGYGGAGGGYANPLARAAAMQNAASNPYYAANPAPSQTPPVGSGLLDGFDTANFVKGALIGAAGAYLLTNENAQKTIFKMIAKATTLFQAGIEEMKERYEDAKAEIEEENG